MPPVPPELHAVEVTTTVDIAASPERVFSALTDPQELAAWWVAPDTLEQGVDQAWDVDAKPGGEWSMTSTDREGREAVVRGEYRIVDPPRELEFSWQASWDGYVTSTVRCVLAPVIVDGEPGTRLRVTHVTSSSLAAHAAVAVMPFGSGASIASLSQHLFEYGFAEPMEIREFVVGDVPHFRPYMAHRFAIMA
ncbi:MAG: SRPBCC domain-containing protein [bacterium]